MNIKRTILPKLIPDRVKTEGDRVSTPALDQSDANPIGESIRIRTNANFNKKKLPNLVSL